MATLKLALDKRRERKDGTYPVVFKLTVKSKQAIISTGVCLPKDEFCDKTGHVKSTPKLTMDLVKLEAIYRARFHDFVIHNHEINDVNELREFIINKPKEEITVYEFWEATIKKLHTMFITSKFSILFVPSAVKSSGIQSQLNKKGKNNKKVRNDLIMIHLIYIQM
jgi:hypothetical protein